MSEIGSMPSLIHTYTGRMIDPLDLKPEDVDIRDIAHHLSNQCRFSGAPREFYGVGQHSVLVSRVVPAKDAFDALMHDAAEYVLQDMARPLKLHPTLGQAYRAAERRAQKVILGVFGLGPEPPSVKIADKLVLVTEARDLMHGVEEWGYYQDTEPLPQRITPWSPRRAEREFLKRFEKLTGINDGMYS